MSWLLYQASLQAMNLLRGAMSTGIFSAVMACLPLTPLWLSAMMPVLTIEMRERMNLPASFPMCPRTPRHCPAPGPYLSRTLHLQRSL